MNFNRNTNQPEHQIGKKLGLTKKFGRNKLIAVVFAIVAVACGFVVLNFARASSPTDAIQGFADYCMLENNTTVIYGWAHNAGAPVGGAPNVSLTVGGQTKAAATDRIYREQQIDSYLASYGVPTSDMYGFRIAYSGLYKGSSPAIGGIITSTTNGTTPPLSINYSHNVDGSTLPYFAGSRVPDACLAVNIPPTTPRPATPRPATPRPATPKPGTTAPPTPVLAPSSFTAVTNSSSAMVSLKWELTNSPDSIKSYSLDRSTDSTNWANIASPTGTNYDDKTTAFDVHYFYRLKAVGNNDLSSDYVLADATTPKFATNSASGSTIKSEDGVVTMVIPEGAIEGEASCSIAAGSEHIDSLKLPPKSGMVAGPYSIVCQNPSGSVITSFAKPLGITISLDKNHLKKYGKLALTGYDGSKDNANWGTLGATVDRTGRIYKFDASTSLDFAVLGQQKAPFPWGAILLLMLVAGVIAAIVLLINRRGGQQIQRQSAQRKYYEY